MSSGSLVERHRDEAAGLVWSLWTELGVPGVARHHAAVAVDLEPLLAATPFLAASDPRLLEQVLSWVAEHHGTVNTGRLSTLVRRLPERPRTAFEEFGATVNEVANTRWPAAGAARGPLPRLRPIRLPLDRPALVRLRARALCGVGTRADVISDLLATRASWSTAAMLAEGGHSKRNVARTLAELQNAGFIVRLQSRNVLQFRLSNVDAFATLLGELPAASARWLPIFELVMRLLELTETEASPLAVRRVEANAVRDALAPIARRLGLPQPPPTKGEPEAWDRLVRWGVDQTAALASGGSPVLHGSEMAPPA